MALGHNDDEKLLLTTNGQPRSEQKARGGHDDFDRCWRDYFFTIIAVQTLLRCVVCLICTIALSTIRWWSMNKIYNLSFVILHCLRLALYLEEEEKIKEKKIKIRLKWRHWDGMVTTKSECDWPRTYLIVLSVLKRIHCGIGLFCFCFLARTLLILKVLWAACKNNVWQRWWPWSIA